MQPLRKLIVPLLFSLIPTASVANELRYEAFWVEGEAASLHTAPLSRQAFLDAGQALAENGFVLVDVETGLQNGERLFAGLWTRGSGSTIFEGPLGPLQLRKSMEARKAQGLRLVDVEIFRLPNGGRQYLGVWRPGSGEQIVTGPMQQDAFFARSESLTSQGLRLRDVEVEEIDGVTLFTGLFRAGAGLNVLTKPTMLGSFRALLPDRLAEGLELIDIERMPNGKDVIGVFRSGDALADVTAPLSFGQYFVLAQDRLNDGQRTRDFEFFTVETDRGNGPNLDPDLPPPGPQNAAHVEFSDNLRLRLEFTQNVDQPFTLTLPVGALPEWLPQDADGNPVLPDSHCGLLIRQAMSAFWQVPGDPEVTQPPFNAVEDVSDIGDEFFLGGIHFAGPIGNCTDTQKNWVFPFPFTSSGPFEPLPNMSLVIELDPDSEISFIKDTGPTPKPIDVDKLFKDDSKKKLKDQVKFWDSLSKQGKNIEKYCPSIGKFWKELCTQFPTDDDVCSEEVADLPDC